MAVAVAMNGDGHISAAHVGRVVFAKGGAQDGAPLACWPHMVRVETLNLKP
jgi:hypothetical protein